MVISTFLIATVLYDTNTRVQSDCSLQHHRIADARLNLISDDQLTFYRYVDKVSGRVVFLPPLHTAFILRNEMPIVRLFDNVRCDSNTSVLVVDVGMNDGVYTVLAASRGCRTISFELQTKCIVISEITLALNSALHHVSIRQQPVSSESGAVFTLDINTDMCDGTYGIDNKVSKGKSRPHLEPISNSSSTQQLSTVSLDDVLHDENTIEFLKIDVEGHEPWVLKGAMGLFRRRAVHYGVFESIHWDRGEYNTTTFSQHLITIAEIFDYGYRLQCINRHGVDLTLPRNIPVLWTKQQFLALTTTGCTDIAILRNHE